MHEYPSKTIKAAAIMMMIMNNLDPAIAQFPEELITYGGNGKSVFDVLLDSNDFRIQKYANYIFQF